MPHHFEIEGVLALLKAATVRAHQTLYDVKGNRFNLVLASAVLEHIPFPRSTLIDLISSVKP